MILKKVLPLQKDDSEFILGRARTIICIHVIFEPKKLNGLRVFHDTD